MAQQPDLFGALAPRPTPPASPQPEGCGDCGQSIGLHCGSIPPCDAHQGTDHRCLGCGKVHADAREVTLVDGSKASSYSEAWRLECEARAILALPDLQRRQSHLWRLEKTRGKAAADGVRKVMLDIWNARQAEKMRA